MQSGDLDVGASAYSSHQVHTLPYLTPISTLNLTSNPTEPCSTYVVPSVSSSQTVSQQKWRNGSNRSRYLTSRGPEISPPSE